ncbi:hypothetical protein AKJ51_03380 [candidate division MSBL1 archaeon SCGC-AAA382A20]|uniref:Uncharacterized protein n=1 Tax=candidate division MSBL1 archaeon SCGC-AAA382A20 TaxID=1698280 RepID=A0A133VJK4_9EURY|nr:hypothetical protein AKJ51_03380 [candidate division MSBL1 archaeon SCGC-AAA382A20]
MRIEKYVDEFSKILKALRGRKWKVDFDEAEVSLAILREVAKDRRMENIEARRQRSAKGEPATEKQKEYMDDLGILYDEGITKEKASEEIERALEEGSPEQGSG